MKIDRARNTKRNIVSGLVNKFVTLLGPFALRSVLIQTLGADYLGIDSLFTSMLQMLNLVELGFTNAIVYSMYKPIADDDAGRICALLALYRKVYRVVGIAILIAGICLTPFLSRFMADGAPKGLHTSFLFLAYVLNTAIGYLFYAYKASIFVAYQRNDETYNVLSITSLLMYGLQIGFLIFAKNVYLYAYAMPCCTLFYNVLVNTLANRRFPDYKPSGFLPREDVLDLGKRIIGILIGRLSIVSRNSLGSVLVSTMFGLTTVAMYGNYYYILAGVHAILIVATNAMASGIGNSVALDSIDKNYADMRRFTFIYAAISGVATCCMINAYDTFIAMWVGSEMVFPFRTAVLFGIYFYALSMGDIRSLYVQANGLWWENRYRSIIEAICNVILPVVGGAVFGLDGVLFGTILSLFLVNFIYGSQIIFSFYFKNGKWGEFLSDHLQYIAVTAVICIASHAVCIPLRIDGLFGFIGKAVISALVGAVIFLVIFSRSRRLHDALGYLRGAILR